MAKSINTPPNSDANSSADDNGRNRPRRPHWPKILILAINILVLILSIIFLIKTRFSGEWFIVFLLALPPLLNEIAFIKKAFKKYSRLFFFISMTSLIASIIVLSIVIINSRVVFKIHTPTSNQESEQTISSVNGIYKNLPENDLIWIIVQDREKGLFYLGDAVLATKRGSKKKGDWEALNVPVGSFSDAGKPFYIWAILVKENSTAQKEMLDWKNKKDSQGHEALPSHEKSTVIRVIRK